MITIATFGYGTSAIAYLVLTVLLATAWRGRGEGAVLLIASLLSSLWAGVCAYQATTGYTTSLWTVTGELLRDAAWLIFLLLLFFRARQQSGAQGFLGFVTIAAALLVGAIVVVLGYAVYAGQDVPTVIGFDLRVLSFLLLGLLGLVLVEQLFRNTPLALRWSLKYLCLGLGALFAYDFYLYSDAMLTRGLDVEIWGARGFVNAMVVPLIAVSAARNPQWSLDVFVSRSFVFHTTTLLGGGIYLLAMAAGGYYIKHIGGNWGGLAQLTFLFGMGLILFMLLFSGQMRARMRVFLSKHFFNYRYDYREEWLRFINTLSESKLDVSLRTTVISAMAQIVESPSGMLWLQKAANEYYPAAGWNMSDAVTYTQPDNQSLIQFLAERHWVIDITEVEEEPESYPGLELPDWLRHLPSAWLVVPLLSSAGLVGFVVLSRPRVSVQVNWEVRDLLLTTGRQSASYLALLQTNEQLVDARQFEAFNRLSAYVVHDLKNVIAQLSLIVANSAKHRQNPAFVDDAFNTIDNAVAKMNRMLGQLRKGRVESGDRKYVDLKQVLEKVVSEHSGMKPIPTFGAEDGDYAVLASEDRLAAVLGHLIQNAQEATAAEGRVHVQLSRHGVQALVEIQDTGCGMDGEFIRERLFRPFETTKGNAGMGIGVYESREFIVALGGAMAVESEPGVGTTFSIHLNIEKEARVPDPDMNPQHVTIVR
jgi:putative PEP-CTERM system histidine kinase